MTEPAEDGGMTDPSMLKTVAVQDGDRWIINGRKAFITGAVSARGRRRWPAPTRATARRPAPCS